MNKDAILATIIGFGVGLVIAGLVFLGPALFKGMPHLHFPDLSFLSKLKSTSNKPKPTPKPTKQIASKLTIESPLAESIEPKDQTLVSGNTSPNAIVVLEGENGETVVVANATGAYAGNLTLGEGKNDLIVTSYSGSKSESQSVTVYYTPEKF